MIIEKGRVYKANYGIDVFSKGDIVEIISEEDKNGWFYIKSINSVDGAIVHKAMFRKLFEAYTKEEPAKPAHYDTPIDTIDFMKANFSREAVEGFMRGNAIKYLQRAGKKGDKLDDLRKSANYLQMLIEWEEGDKE